jgi:outer membrane protein assembly factor BamA
MKKFSLIFFLFFSSTFVFSQSETAILNIEILGNNRTKKEIILREVTFQKNKNYNQDILKERIKESTENLNNLKLFNFVEITQNEGNIYIEVTEKWYFWPYPVFEISERNFNTWWNEFKANDYSDFSRLNYGIFLNWENFRGRNELLQFKIRRGFKEHYLLSYQIPYFNKQKTIGLNTNLQLFRRKKTHYQTINNQLLYFEDENKYTANDYEANVELLYRKNIHYKHALKLHYFYSSVNDSVTFKNPNYLGNNSNSGNFYKSTYSFTDEHRDYIVYPLHGHQFSAEATKYFEGTNPINHFELKARAEKYIEPVNRLFLGSSFAVKLASCGCQPYSQEEGFGYNDYVRGYEYYVVDGQQFWLSKTALKFAIVEKTEFEIPYVKMKQFNKSHYSIYLGVFSDMGYIKDNQNKASNPMQSKLLWGKGISLDYVTYYDKLLRIEYSVNHLGEKGVFLHFSNPFGSKK